MGYSNEFFFGIYPYIAFTVFIVGSIARLVFVPYTWKSGSSQLLSNKRFVLGSNLFHVGIILLFFGHLIGLLIPHEAYAWALTAGQKQMLAMTAGGAFGAICFIGMVILVHRRLCDPKVRATSSFSDTAILLLLFVQLILGFITIPFSALHPDGTGMLALTQWAQHIATFRGGAATYIVNEAFIFKLHIVVGLTIFLVFPFTRLVHLVSAPVKYFFRRGYQIVRGK